MTKMQKITAMTEAAGNTRPHYRTTWNESVAAGSRKSRVDGGAAGECTGREYRRALERVMRRASK